MYMYSTMYTKCEALNWYCKAMYSKHATNHTINQKLTFCNVFDISLNLMVND